MDAPDEEGRNSVDASLLVGARSAGNHSPWRPPFYMAAATYATVFVGLGWLLVQSDTEYSNAAGRSSAVAQTAVRIHSS